MSTTPVNRSRLSNLWKYVSTLAVGVLVFYVTEAATRGRVSWGLLAVILFGGGALLAHLILEVRARLDRLTAPERREAPPAPHDTDGPGPLPHKSSPEPGGLLTQESFSDGFSPSLLTELASNARRLDDTTPRLARMLASQEIRAASDFLNRLQHRDDITYDGEARDWLLGLTRHADHSILATSLTTVDAGGRGFVDGGLWLSDFGQRYVEAQRMAVDRGAQVKRVFIMDRPDLLADPSFLEIYQQQRSYGIQVRVLDPSEVYGESGSPSDFIVFDDKISFETTASTHPDPEGRPIIVETSLVLRQERVDKRIAHFDELWKAAR